VAAGSPLRRRVDAAPTAERSCGRALVCVMPACWHSSCGDRTAEVCATLRCVSHPVLGCLGSTPRTASERRASWLTRSHDHLEAKGPGRPRPVKAASRRSRSRGARALTGPVAVRQRLSKRSGLALHPVENCSIPDGPKGECRAGSTTPPLRRQLHQTIVRAACRAHSSRQHCNSWTDRRRMLLRAIRVRNTRKLPTREAHVHRPLCCNLKAFSCPGQPSWESRRMLNLFASVTVRHWGGGQPTSGRPADQRTAR
jgi:hypothetical protein